MHDSLARHAAPTSRSAVLRRRMRPLAALALACAWCGPTYAIDIVAIEEHWELQVGEPDPDSSSPQVCMVMSPTGHLESDYFVFTLNHHSAPTFAPGGLQVQQWNGESLVDSAEAPERNTLQNHDETVRWVQRIEIVDGTLKFEISEGQSDSWGSFGNGSHLQLSTSTTLTSLNGFLPAVSLQESGISFAGNRVRTLTLKKLRWFDSQGNAYELNAPIDIDADLDP